MRNPAAKTWSEETRRRSSEKFHGDFVDVKVERSCKAKDGLGWMVNNSSSCSNGIIVEMSGAMTAMKQWFVGHGGEKMRRECNQYIDNMPARTRLLYFTGV